jgi:hypothetical protein
VLLTRARLLVPLVATVALAGAGVTAWQLRMPPLEPLAPLGVETLAPPTGVDLPHHVVGGGPDGTAFSFDSPVEAEAISSGLSMRFAEPPELSSMGVLWYPEDEFGDSVESFTDFQRRHPEDSQLTGDVVVEHSALGTAYRKDLAMTSGVTTTQWAVEHDDVVYLVEWVHRPGDDRWRSTVEAMIASWRWT